MICKKNKLWINGSNRPCRGKRNQCYGECGKHVLMNGTGSEYGKAIRDVERKRLDDGEEE